MTEWISIYSTPYIWKVVKMIVPLRILLGGSGGLSNEVNDGHD